MATLTHRLRTRSARVRKSTPLQVEALEARLALTTEMVFNTADYPFCPVVQIEVANGDGGAVGSGVLIDRNHVLTAGHVLYDHDPNGIVDKVTVRAGRDGNFLPFGEARGVRWSVHRNYVYGDQFTQESYDIGVITLDRPLGDETGWYGFTSYSEGYFNQGGTINILGYPSKTLGGKHLYLGSGPALSSTTHEIRYYGADLFTEGGNSGGPLFVMENGDPYVVGVVARVSPDGGSLGFSVRLTEDKVNWIIDRLNATPAASATPIPGADTLGVFDPGSGTFYLRNSNSGGGADVQPFAFGGPGWTPLAGDWDGDGSTTIGVFAPDGTWYLRNQNSGGGAHAGPFAFGGAGWIPLAGDWDGDGITTIGVFDPATATFYLRNSNGSGAPDVTPFAFGAPGWMPIAGDWNGDGITTIGVVDPSTGTWYLRDRNTGGTPSIAPFAYGAPGWTPVAGDWDGDGVATVGAINPATATWYLRNSNSGGSPSITPFAYGAPGWRPVAGDWDGALGDRATSQQIDAPVDADLAVAVAATRSRTAGALSVDVQVRDRAFARLAGCGGLEVDALDEGDAECRPVRGALTCDGEDAETFAALDALFAAGALSW